MKLLVDNEIPAITPFNAELIHSFCKPGPRLWLFKMLFCNMSTSRDVSRGGGGSQVSKNQLGLLNCRAVHLQIFYHRLIDRK